jgi:hypothetical protein
MDFALLFLTAHSQSPVTGAAVASRRFPCRQAHHWKGGKPTAQPFFVGRAWFPAIQNEKNLANTEHLELKWQCLSLSRVVTLWEGESIAQGFISRVHRHFGECASSAYLSPGCMLLDM